MSLKDHIVARIDANGPISIADYMAECLFHPTHGYYTTREAFGVQGDFTTAPEISQMFGEVLGLALAQAWIDQGAPAPFTLAELGPGRGTLMADVLRATAQVPGFTEAADLHLIEASPRLREQQKAALSGHKITWGPDVTALPEQPLFLIANEFFDALPIRQFQKTASGWCERQVGLNGTELTIGLAPASDLPALTDRLADTRDGDIVEVAPQAAGICSAISHLIAKHGGAAYIIDYGDWRSLGDTLQAVRDHTYVSPLERPGQSDLTAQVDFEALSRAAVCAFSKLTPQGIFLERLGITPRAQALAARLTGDVLDQHIAAHRRLTHPGEMGNLFKVFGLFPSGKPPPPGLDA